MRRRSRGLALALSVFLALPQLAPVQVLAAEETLTPVERVERTVGAGASSHVPLAAAEQDIFGAGTIIDRGTCGTRATWTLDSEGKLIIGGSGELDHAAAYPYTAWEKYKGQIRSVEIGPGITALGNYAFEELTLLEEMVIPGTVKSIKGSVFRGCTGLKSVVIPEGISVINEGAFGGCTSLQEVTIPSSVVTVSSMAFDGCVGLRDVYYGGSRSQWDSFVTINDGNDALLFAAIHCEEESGPVEIDRGPCGTRATWTLDSEGKLTIGGSGELDHAAAYPYTAWEKYKGQIRSVEIGPGITALGNYAFEELTLLEEMVVPGTVKSIKGSVFRGCTGLKSVVIPEGISVINEGAFGGCTSLQEVTIPSSVVTVSSMAFDGCVGLRDVYYGGSRSQWDSFVTIDDGNDALLFATIHCEEEGGPVEIDRGPCGTRATWTLDSEGKLTIGGSGELDHAAAYPYTAWEKYKGQIRSVEIGPGITALGNYAFEELTLLEEMVIPDTVKSIKGSVFHGCTGLKSVVIPEGIDVINWEAFGGCTSLREVTIPSSVRVISAKAFDGCTELKNVHYGGSQFQWEHFVAIESQNDPLLFADIDYAGGVTVTLDVSLHAAGGTVFPSRLTVTEGQAYGSLPTPVRGGYSFVGWFTASGGGQQVTAQTVVSAAEDHSLYAQWEKESDNAQIPTINALTYSFSNSRSGFNYPKDYFIPKERYVMMFGDTVAADWYYISDKKEGWGGNCYGVSSSTGMFFHPNGFSPSAYKAGTTTPSGLAINDKNALLGLTIRETIEGLQISQYSSKIQMDYNKNKGDLDGLVDAVSDFNKTGKNPVIIGVFQNGGHAVVGYKVEKVNPTTSHLYVYDCNHPKSADRKIILTTTANGKCTGWSYDMGGYGIWSSSNAKGWITYVPYADFYAVWNDRAVKNDSAHMTMLTVSEDVKIKDGDGKVLASVENGELVTSETEIYPMIEFGILDDEARVEPSTKSYYLPPAAYVIERSKPSDVTPMEASMMDVDQSAHVSTTANEVMFAVEDAGTNSINYVSVGAQEKGKEFEVTLNSTLDSAEYGNVTVSGKVLDEALCFMQRNGMLQTMGLAVGTAIKADGQTLQVVSAGSQTETNPIASFQSNGGSGSMPVLTAEADWGVTLPECGFLPPSGKVFDSWMMGARSCKPGERISLTGNTTFKASWKDDESGGETPGGQTPGGETPTEEKQAIISGRDPQPIIGGVDSEGRRILYLVKGQTYIIEKTSATSSISSIVRVSGKYKLQAKSRGETDLTVGDVRYRAHVAAPALSKKSISLVVGQTETLALDGFLKGDEAKYPATWVSAKPEIASVTDDGKVAAYGKGTAKITAYVGGRAYNCTVKVQDKYPVAKLADKDTLSMAPFQSATVKFKDGTKYKDPVWSTPSGDLIAVGNGGKVKYYENDVVRVTPKGKVTAIGPGSTSLTVRMSDGVTRAIRVSVPMPERRVYLTAGQSRTLLFTGVKAAKAKWSSSDGKVAEVNGKGKVSAISYGETTVSCEYQPYERGGFVFNTKVYVEEPVLTIGDSIINSNKGELDLKPGGSTGLKLMKVYQPYFFNSNKNNIAFPDDSGMICAREAGTAKLTVTINKKKFTVQVKVAP